MCDQDFFKQDFKYYKKKNPPPNLDQVLDFYKGEQYESVSHVTSQILSTADDKHCTICENLGLRQHRNWEVFSLKHLDGFFYVKNPFKISGQKTWIRKCLELYPRKPSITNLDLHYKDLDDVWSLQKDPDHNNRSLLSKLCWATLGYHHNWDSKVYDRNHKSDLPICLEELTQHIAYCLGFTKFKPEAAIVNYYNSKSNLGIHNDHSEEDHTAPIISLSFGQTGLFLIGTENKLIKPAAMLLKSGDIIVMSGACRLSYHAVPCILMDDFSDRYFKSKDDDWLPFRDYINTARVNISVRQVYGNKDSS